MSNDKTIEQITFDECVKVIMDISECREIPHIVKAEDIFRLDELEKTLEYSVIVENYQFRYISKTDTIHLNDLAYSFDSKNPKNFGLTPGVVDNDAPYITVRKDDFGKNKPNLFQALVLFTLRYQRMNNLQNELPIKDNGVAKEIKKI